MIHKYIAALLSYAEKNQLMEKEDRVCLHNWLIDMLGLSEAVIDTPPREDMTIDEILDGIVDYAVKNNIIEDSAARRDLFDTRIMGLFTDKPSAVAKKFYGDYEISPVTATDNYYKYSKDLNYVRAGRIAKDICWKYPCQYGELDITINRSKPEKDPRDIAAAGKAKSASYPKCMLCIENTGFAGTLTHPARQNLRPVPVKVNGGDWFFQYSPYGYYNEHCIVFNSLHIPMKIDRAVFDKLFDIVELLPHYFIGSNADLPIVGGSILSHEHFQGGHYTFTMENAPEEEYFTMAGFENISAARVKWPMSVIRLRGKDRKALGDACDKVLTQWRAYTDEKVGIFAFTDDVPHNTITPIARKKGDEFECDLVLRNNITTEDRPLGVFHPNPSLHHIKKENIGLIEVMGLAVLPARLANELPLMASALLDNNLIEKDERISGHKKWLSEIAKTQKPMDIDSATEIIKQEIGKVFMQVLLDAGVFKRDDEGIAAFERFIDTLR